MALTTHEQIRVEANFQYRYNRESFQNSPDGAQTTFYVHSDAPVKLVPEFGTGGTIAGISDVQVYLGLSGIYGVSRLGVSAIDVEQGSVQLSVAPVTGSSLVINYSSSAIPSKDIEEVRLRAESIINQRLSICYSLPISPTPSSLSSLSARLAAAFLLIRGYGNNSGIGGNELYKQLMGNNQTVTKGTDSEAIEVGEIGLICTSNYQLVDDSGNVIPRNDEGQINASTTFNAGGRINGVLFDITEEPFRKKPWQSDVDREQAGSGIY